MSVNLQCFSPFRKLCNFLKGEKSSKLSPKAIFSIHKKSSAFDVLVLSLFTILITFHPYYLWGELNLFELGLYLPGINAILHGLVPYRDFFHLRGPLELYIPAAMMQCFGVNVSVLSTYFYFGTVLTLLLCVLIAAQVVKSRLFLYLVVPALIARTFPRVVFTYWGGMRFAFGLMSVLFLIYALKRKKSSWWFISGLTAGLAVFTSAEVGVCSVLSAVAVFIALIFFKRKNFKAVSLEVMAYVAGGLAIVGPYVIYLVLNNALVPYMEAVWGVVTRMPVVIDTHLTSQYPATLGQAFVAMINPGSKNFRHLTPMYLYLTLFIYLGWKAKVKDIRRRDLILIALGTYGILLYAVSFRAMLGAQFEMALQPEKILWFCILEFTFFLMLIKKIAFGDNLKRFCSPLGNLYNFLKGKKRKLTRSFPQPATLLPSQGALKYSSACKIRLLNFVLCFIILFTLGNAFARYNHRFFIFQFIRGVFAGKNIEDILPLAADGKEILNIERAKGMRVPSLQAAELEDIVSFISQKTKDGQSVLMYPDQGIYNFLFDRPFVGRFPVAVFAWFEDRWYKEFMNSFKGDQPRFIIFPKELPAPWKTAHLTPFDNQKKYDDMMSIVQNDYVLARTTVMSNIYQRKDGR